MGSILYLGEFQLPDKNAAAQRVVNVSKILCDLQKKVILCGVSEADTKIYPQEILGTSIQYYEKKKQRIWKRIKNILTFEFEKKLIEEISDLEYIVCYNYDFFNLLRLRYYCKKNKVKLVGDITEWYDKSNLRFPLNILKDLDTFFRMKYINKKLDYLICISQFLNDYYKSENCIYLPGMVDIKDIKWRLKKEIKLKDEIEIIFIGNPGENFEKERLDLVVKAILNFNKDCRRKIKLKVVGNSQKNIEKLNLEAENNQSILFMGKISHERALEELKKSDFSIIPREDKINISAGFPTKLGESLCCGIPVITTSYGDISKYITNKENGILIEKCTMDSILETLVQISKFTNEDLEKLKEEAYNSRVKLDYRNFIDEAKKIF